MLDLINTSFYLQSPVFHKEDISNYSDRVFEEWATQVEQNLSLPDYALTLIIEEGSIKGIGKIATAVGGLYFAIGNYGSFISGIQIIEAQAAFVSSQLFNTAKVSFECVAEAGNTRSNGGEIFYLKRLFERVRSGQVSPDEAVSEVQSRWGENALESPEFMLKMADALKNTPRYPQQLPLPDAFWEPCEEPSKPLNSPKPIKKKPRPLEVPISEHYRVEIFRPRKRSNKTVKLFKVK